MSKKNINNFVSKSHKIENNSGADEEKIKNEIKTEVDNSKDINDNFDNCSNNEEISSQDLHDVDTLKEIQELNNIHVSWRDYVLMMLNSTAEPLRSIWREKIVTSKVHWEFNSGSIGENSIIGLQILSDLPDDFTEMLVDDHYSSSIWYKQERLTRSKRMKVFLGHYPQESLTNEANICVRHILSNWDKYSHLLKNSRTLMKMWDISQKSNGKCILPDEILTYILEKPFDDKDETAWLDACDDVFTNGIPSQTYAKYWKTDKIENYPLAEKENNKDFCYKKKVIDKNGNINYEDLSLEEQKENFKNFCDIILKESVAESPCWKKIAICILKNDVTFKYCGFAPTLRERQCREEAMAAFSSKQKEKQQAKENAKILAEKIEKERKENEV